MHRAQTFLFSVLNSIYATWAVLALPALPLLRDVVYPNRYYPELMWESGVLSSQLIVVALAISPMLVLFRRFGYITKLLMWLLRRRRALGVAAFGYAALHTYFYLRYTGSVEEILLELGDADLAIGWVGFIAIFILAVTSNSLSIRLLNKRWKPVQRLAYPMAALVALHWLLIGNFVNDLYMLTAILVCLQLTRITIRAVRKFRLAI